MGRAFLIVLDSVGCGGAPDAADFGDEGANTLGHIAMACAAGKAEEGRSGPLNVPNLNRLGLGAAMNLSTGTQALPTSQNPEGFWGAAQEVSIGKDTPSGHWELAGFPIPWDWHVFPQTTPAFPLDVLDHVAKFSGGSLLNAHSGGIAAIAKYGQEHIKMGHPICYTSVDSVFQIAAHEEYFGLQRLYDLCEHMSDMLHPMKLGRVIARPFVGSEETGFKRTANRKDFAIEPPLPTLLDRASEAGCKTHSIGKIDDIFSGRGIDISHKGADDMALFDKLVTLFKDAEDNSFIFANFVEFDSLYGHTRDVSGYARALEIFDARVPELLENLRDDDLVIFTADHGNDPTWQGSDHTREQVPVIGIAPHVLQKPIGIVGFSDVGETIAAHLGLKAGDYGKSFL